LSFPVWRFARGSRPTHAGERCTCRLESVALTLESVVLALESVVLASLSFPVWRFARGSRPTHAGERCTGQFELSCLALCQRLAAYSRWRALLRSWLMPVAFAICFCRAPGLDAGSDCALAALLRRARSFSLRTFGPCVLLCASSGFLDHWPLLHARLLIPLRILIPRRISNLRL
jgi:hypothetical protein